MSHTICCFPAVKISRKEKYKPGHPVHFCSSLFYTQLSSLGAEAVSSWTKRMRVDDFTKKFVMIPVNASAHWSLCVVVNPGVIQSYIEPRKEAPAYDEPYPCILFFDSLTAGNKDVVAARVRIWLNAEWRRLQKCKGHDRENPFTSSSLKVHVPIGEYHCLFGWSFPALSLNRFSYLLSTCPFSVPRQNNTWDCGLFVCRYASALYSMHDSIITFGHAEAANGGPPFKRVITDSDAFNFDGEAICRLREDFGNLIKRLSDMYKMWMGPWNKANCS